MRFFNHKFFVLLLSTCLLHYNVKAQTLSADDLFQQARTESFDHKNYDQAINLCNRALQLAPAYVDVALFKGRIFLWSHQPDSARQVFIKVLDADAANVAAYAELASLENNLGQYEKALHWCAKGMQAQPHNETLLVQQAKTYIALKNYSQAQATLSLLVRHHPNHAEAVALRRLVRSSQAQNAITAAYQYTGFAGGKQAPWQLAQLSYGRKTGRGSVTGGLLYVRRFGNESVQAEVESYQHFTAKLYGYAAVSVAEKNSLFPRYRAAFSLFAGLPKGFEAEAGIRYLHFDAATFIYTAALGKYWKNYWLQARTYITPGGMQTAQSYALTGRYYFKGGVDYFFLTAGHGLSPDERNSNLLYQTSLRASSTLNAGWRKSVGVLNSFTLSAGWMRQEYPSKIYGHQFEGRLSFQQRF